MDILFSHTYFYKMDAKQWKNKTPFPPLGTIYAAALLRKNKYSVSLFDVGLKNDPQELETVLIEAQPKYFVIYDDGFNYLTKMCLTTMREAAFKMIKIAKAQNCIVIVSSSDSTDHYSNYMDHGADFIIYGEGEQTLLNLINTISSKQNLESVNGIFRLADGNIIKNKKRDVLINLDELPMPAWDLIDINNYKKVWKKSRQEFTLNIATTRGCPFHCNWCAKPIYGQRYNSHSPNRIVEMISFLQKEFQVNRFWMCDDIFGLKPNWVQEFRDQLIRQRIKIKYYIQSRADLLLKEDTIEALAESGIEEVWIGAESGSQKILDAMDKGITITQIERSTKLLQSNSINVAFFIQFGYLGETKEDISKTIAMIKRLKPNNIGVSVSYPLPDTPFYEKVKDQFKTKRNWKDSDDLAMLFKGTFNQGYYRKLQRITHKEFRISKGFENLQKFLRHPLGLNYLMLRSIILLSYYIPTSWLDKIYLNNMENNNA